MKSNEILDVMVKTNAYIEEVLQIKRAYLNLEEVK
jgi:hypothetical protein